MSVLVSFYIFIFPDDPVYDYTYLLYTFILPFHWTFLNGECLCTYIYKKLSEPGYIAGSQVVENADLHFANNKHIMNITNIAINIFLLFEWYSILAVAYRRNIHILLPIFFIICWAAYRAIIFTHEDHVENKNFQRYQSWIRNALLVYLVFLMLEMRRASSVVVSPWPDQGDSVSLMDKVHLDFPVNKRFVRVNGME